ncbi:hypothetical protein LCGC14_3162370 [marine sediment metagenome]|uniref:Uncharacterized protein n=1 Tax=marine sediment metagenome TaxID=412755 RepID=A0A0F8WF14_9ZZZZ
MTEEKIDMTEENAGAEGAISLEDLENPLVLENMSQDDLKNLYGTFLKKMLKTQHENEKRMRDPMERYFTVFIKNENLGGSQEIQFATTKKDSKEDVKTAKEILTLVRETQ